ncbi:MAG: hypothetical protein C0603_09810 [Denitrovibrio sp.]|nr:MAG: hypothetical protein C0603_09810 [Denitrovibrio sp.]
MSIVTSRYSKFKPLINSDISLPFSPFSSALERTFLYNLAKEIDTEGSILEIGAYSGGTSIALGTGNKDSKFKNKIFSIDCAFQQDYPVFIQHAGLSDYIITRQCPSQYFASVASDVFTLNAGSDKMRLVWIDGDHSYEGCLSDLKLYKPFLRDNGILVIHDYGAEDSLHGGITQAVFEEVISDPEYSNFAVVDTIFYAEKNRSKPFIDFDAIEKFTVKSANDPYSCVVFMNDNYSFKNKKTCIYGAGQHTESILNYTRTSQQFSDIYDSITLLIDDQEAANGSIHNKPIINFDALNENDFDYIIVSSYDYENIMLDKLLTKVKNKSRIISFYNNNDFIDKLVSNINTITSQELLDRVFPVKNLTEYTVSIFY